VTIAPSALVVIPGRPPSLNARYGHHMARARETAMWRQRAHLLAGSARVEARWPLPVRCDPPAPRYLEIDCYRVGVLDETDNLPGSVKALVDGCVGTLLVQDNAKWVRLARPIKPHRVATALEERTEIRVWLCDPRPAVVAEETA
jgi:hypothetical protein